MPDAFLAIRDASTLRMSIGLHETWWVAGAFALLLMLACFLLWTRYRRSGQWLRVRLLIGVMGMMTALFYFAAIRLATANYWTPADDPDDFHHLISAPNYRALDDWWADHRDQVPTIEKLAKATADKRITINPYVEWPYFTDVDGRMLQLDMGRVLQTSGHNPQQLRRPDEPPGDVRE